MTDRSKLLALAEDVEKLTGPDREVDAEIARTVYADNCRNPDWECGYVLAYTASIDAAMTLVPDTCTVNLMMGKDRPNAAQVHHFLTGALIPHKQSVASASTPALALCAAALRAQAEALS